MANVFYGVGPPIVNGKGGLREAFGQLGPLNLPGKRHLGYLGKGFTHGVPIPIFLGGGSMLPFSVRIFKGIIFRFVGRRPTSLTPPPL